MIVAIFYRDSSVSFFRSIAATRNFVLAARWSGKLKAVVQGVGTQLAFVALVAFQLAPEATWLEAVPWWTMLVITLVTLYSLGDYFLGNLPLLRDAWTDRPVS